LAQKALGVEHGVLLTMGEVQMVRAPGRPHKAERPGYVRIAPL